MSGKLGVLVTMEGGEGTGKSTLLDRLRDRLDREGIPSSFIREPGGTPVGEAVRKVLLDARLAEMHPRTELFLYEASRSQLVEEEIRPSLAEGKLVLCDRFYDSTTAYQGIARGLDLDFVRKLNAFAVGGLVPDLTLLLDLDVEAAFERGPHSRNSEGGDRLEQEPRTFHRKVREAYLRIAAEEPDRIRVLDARKSRDQVFDEAWSALRACWDRRPGA